MSAVSCVWAIAQSPTPATGRGRLQLFVAIPNCPHVATADRPAAISRSRRASTAAVVCPTRAVTPGRLRRRTSAQRGDRSTSCQRSKGEAAAEERRRDLSSTTSACFARHGPSARCRRFFAASYESPRSLAGVSEAQAAQPRRLDERGVEGGELDAGQSRGRGVRSWWRLPGQLDNRLLLKPDVIAPRPFGSDGSSKACADRVRDGHDEATTPSGLWSAVPDQRFHET